MSVYPIRKKDTEDRDQNTNLSGKDELLLYLQVDTTEDQRKYRSKKGK